MRCVIEIGRYIEDDAGRSVPLVEVYSRMRDGLDEDALVAAVNAAVESLRPKRVRRKQPLFPDTGLTSETFSSSSSSYDAANLPGAAAADLYKDGYLYVNDPAGRRMRYSVAPEGFVASVALDNDPDSGTHAVESGPPAPKRRGRKLKVVADPNLADHLKKPSTAERSATFDGLLSAKPGDEQRVIMKQREAKCSHCRNTVPFAEGERSHVLNVTTGEEAPCEGVEVT